MSTEVKVRRGTAAQNAAFTGVEGEVTYSTDEKRLITHDGSTVGGDKQAKLSEVELVANKSNNTALGASATLYPTQNAVKSYADTGLALKVAKAGDTMTGALVHPAGTAAAPSITFVGDLDTGIFSSGANEVGLVSTGIPIFSIKGDLFSYFNRQSADNLAAGFTVDKRGAIGDANGAVVSGAVISLNQARGWDGAAYGVVGDIRFVAAETLTGVAHGGQLLVRLTPVGSTTVVTVGTWASTGLTLAGTLDMGTHLINNVVNPVSAQDAATKSYVDTAVAGVGSPPFTDTTALVKGSADATKLMRFEVDGFTTATTRVLTPPNADITLAGINIAQTFAQDQTFGKRILLPDTTSATVGGIYFNGTLAVHNFGTGNFAAGVGAGNLTMTGYYNTFFGNGAGASNSLGQYNSFFGSSAGVSNTDGNNNSFFGKNTGQSNSIGLKNSFFGANAGLYNTTASYNSFFGESAGKLNTTGYNNAFFGAGSGLNNVGGGFNAFFGAGSGLNNVGGGFNAFFGANAGASNTANGNSFFGSGSGIASSTGVSNSFFGKSSGLANTTGAGNCFFGASAGQSNIDGFFNVFLGTNAGLLNDSGTRNLFVGHAAGDNVTSGSFNIVIGYDINAPSATGSNQLSLGNLIFGTGVDGTGTTISSGNIGIAVVTPHSGLQVGRSFALPYRAITGTDTFAATDYTINTTSGTFTLNLPTAVGITGRLYVAKNSGAGVVTLDANGGELIDGVTTQTINPGTSLTVQSTNAGWIII